MANVIVSLAALVLSTVCLSCAYADEVFLTEKRYKLENVRVLEETDTHVEVQISDDLIVTFPRSVVTAINPGDCTLTPISKAAPSPAQGGPGGPSAPSPPKAKQPQRLVKLRGIDMPPRVAFNLLRKTDVDFDNKPVQEVIESLLGQAGANVTIDPELLKGGPGPFQRPVTLQSKNMPAIDVLLRVLRERRLWLMYKDGSLFISTADKINRLQAASGEKEQGGPPGRVPPRRQPPGRRRPPGSRWRPPSPPPPPGKRGPAAGA